MCTGMTSYRRADGWNSVNESLPDPYIDVIVCLETREVYYGWYDSYLRIWHDIHGAEIESVPHWRALPDPPRMEESKE